MKITNKKNLPDALVEAITTHRHNDPGRLSATTLLKGTKEIILTDRHWDDLEEDVEDRIWALVGTTMHKVLEKEGKNDFSEEFMSSEVDGITVTGRIDNYNLETEVVTDWKSVSVFKILFQDFESWRQQGLIYAWLLHKNGFVVKTCRFVAIIKDHRKREARRKPSYPQTPLYVYQFDVTPEGLEEIEVYIKNKIALFKQQEDLADDDIPPCTPEERWDKPTKYAVKKEGRKSAVRVLDIEEMAQKMAADLGKGHSVEIRPGESTRCMEYCSCCEFCDYYRNHVAAAAVEEPEAIPA